MLQRHTLGAYGTRLSVFFMGNKIKKNITTSYYLLGQRGDYLIFRVSALADTLHRLYVFLRAGAKQKLTGWLLSWGVGTLSLSLWFARNGGTGAYMQLGRKYALIWWNGRFFALRTFYFSINTARFIGADYIVTLTPPNRLGKYQVSALRSFGIPTIGIEYNIARLGFFNFCLPQSTTRPRGLLFYSRLLVCLIDQR